MFMQNTVKRYQGELAAPASLPPSLLPGSQLIALAACDHVQKLNIQSVANPTATGNTGPALR